MGNLRKKENKIIVNYGDYLEIDISTPKHPDAIMLIDRLDWASLQTLKIGRVIMGILTLPKKHPLHIKKLV